MGTMGDALAIYTTQSQMSSFFIDKIGIMSVKSYGAVGDGVADDTSAINAALTAAVDGNVIYFPKGIYKITSKITVSKRVELRGATHYNTHILNNSTDDAILINQQNVKVRDILIKGTVTSKSGLVVGKESCDVIDVFSTENGEHGIKILPNVWIINLVRCNTFNNSKSGVYAVSSGSAGQVNSINILDGHSWLNDEHGVAITGTSVKIKGSTIENNLKAGVFVSTNTYSIFGLDISGNYFEGNKDGHVVFSLYPSLGYRVYGCEISANYLYLNASQVNPGVTSIINGTTDTVYDGIVNFVFDRSNVVLTDTLKHISIGSSIHKEGQSHIEPVNAGDSPDYSAKYDALGTCGIDHYQKTMVINGYFFAKGISYGDLEKTANIIGTVGTTTILFPMTFPSGKQFKKAGVYITTDSTNYAVIFSISKRDAGTGAAFAGVTGQTVSGNSGSKLVEMSDITALVSPNNGRIQANEEYYLQLQFTNGGGGTNFQVHNPIITYTE